MENESKRTILDLSLWVAGLLAGMALVAHEAMAESRLATPPNATWKAECATCHIAYPPQLLPAEAWRRMMAGLERHFGIDASVEPALAAEIGAYLERHSASGKRARGEEFHAPRCLCRTIKIFAAPCDKFRVPPDGTAANGTFPANVFCEIERLRVSRPLRFHNFNDRGNDFSRLFDHDRVTDANVFAFDFVLVVQSGAGDGASAYQHRFQYRYRREDSGASNLNDDVLQTGLDTFGRVFVSDRPPGRFRSEPELLALRERVHFDNCAVGLIRKIASDVIELGRRDDEREQSLLVEDRADRMHPRAPIGTDRGQEPEGGRG